MSSINATAGSPTQPTALISSGDNTSTLTFQTNTSNAITIYSTQIANFSSTGAVVLPSGTTAQRPSDANVANGMMRYNTNTFRIESYLSNNWVTVVAGTGSNYSADYLIVAGGGSGGQDRGAGGADL